MAREQRAMLRANADSAMDASAPVSSRPANPTRILVAAATSQAGQVTHKANEQDGLTREKALGQQISDPLSQEKKFW